MWQNESPSPSAQVESGMEVPGGWSKNAPPPPGFHLSAQVSWAMIGQETGLWKKRKAGGCGAEVAMGCVLCVCEKERFGGVCVDFPFPPVAQPHRRTISTPLLNYVGCGAGRKIPTAMGQLAP